MIFQATWRQVLDGSKSQTRRIVGPNDDWLAGTDYPAHWHSFFEDGHPMVVFPLSEIGDCPISVVTTNERAKWRVGDDYAVQPGRTQKAIGRIRITRIRQERVRDIAEADVEAEGVGLQAWAGEGHEGWPRTAGYAQLWDSLHDRPGEWWADNPAVWVLEFELVKEAGE